MESSSTFDASLARGSACTDASLTPESTRFEALLCEAAALRVQSIATRLLPDVGAIVQDKYKIEAKLGEGGMGAVFRATNLENGKQVALKWLLARSAQALARFSREAQVAARIDHPNVVNVFDFGLHQGERYLVMELLRGESLGERMQGKRLAPACLLDIMIPVLRGLSAAHAMGVIHRDLKPDNVFLCVGADGAQREPKVLDFGISKLRDGSEPHESLTGEGTAIGTLAYMSPEQLVDACNVDQRTDIYAAGVVMYEALTGRLPFRAQSHNALVLAIAGQRPLPMRLLVPELPEPLERVVMRALAKEACDRQASVELLIAELKACQAICSPASNPLARRAQPQTAPQPHARASSTAIKTALIVACVVLAWLARRSNNAEADAEPLAPTAAAVASELALPRAATQARSQRAALAPQTASATKVTVARPEQAPATPAAVTVLRALSSGGRVKARAGAIRLTDL